MGTYVPNTGEEQRRMLESCGFHSFEEMYACIPEELRLRKPLQLPEGKTELEVTRAAEAAARPDVAGYSYDLRTITENVAPEEHELAQADMDSRKVGQPTPGILLSVLMGGGMARLLLRQRRRAMKRLNTFIAHVDFFRLRRETRSVVHFFAPLEPKCCLTWQRVELRL